MRVMARNFVLVSGSRALDGVVRFVTVPLVLHHFGRTDFGLLALAFSMQAFLTVADFGLSVNAVRHFSGAFQRKDPAAVRALAHAASHCYAIIGLVNLAAVVGLGLMAQRWFDLQPAQADQFFWMMLALGLSSAFTWSFAIHRQILQAASRVGWDEAVNLSATALTVAAIGATLYWDLAPATYFALVLLPQVAPTVMRVRKVKDLVPGYTVGFGANWPLFRPLVGTSLWLFLLTLAELLANNYRPVILAQQAGLESVTDFRIIQQIASFAMLLLSGCMAVVYPTIARLDAADDHVRIRAAIARGSRLLLWAHLALLVAMAFMSELMLRLYVGTAYTHLAAPLALWLVTLVAYHNAIMSSVVIARARLRAITIAAVIHTVLTLATTYWFAPRYGVMAAVWSYALYVGLQLGVMYFIAAPSAGAGSGAMLFTRVLTGPVVAALGCAAVALFGVRALHTGYWIGALIFFGIFIAVALTMGGVRRDWASLKALRAAS